MKLSDFSFELPDELIARYPTEQRDASRLLRVVDDSIEDKNFADLVELLTADDCLIFNDTKVIPARLLGNRESGGKVEVLVERIADEHEFLAMVRSSNALPEGTILKFGGYQLEVLGRDGGFYKLKTLDNVNIFDLLEAEGHIPLPPYIDRADGEFDKERYQTVYAKEEGAVAAPTAGLHFTDDIFTKLKEKGVRWEFVTLHVGSGTFAPVRVDDIEKHTMHSEWYRVPQAAADLVNETRASGGRVVAVGTTSVRSLESANYEERGGRSFIMPTTGDTDIFIYPGYEFRFVDSLITNFHLPESTLIMLVSALIGKETILRAYRHAVENKYRFFSYGDAMLLERKV